MALVVRDAAAPFIPGEWVFINYGVEGEPWHERLVLAEVGNGDYVVYTPDQDVYVELLRVPPLREVRHVGLIAGVPAGLGARFGQPIYRFTRRPSPAKLGKLIDEGADLAKETIGADPRRYAALALPAPAPSAAGLAADMFADPDLVWICVDPASEKFKVGQAVGKAEISGAVSMGGRALYRERPGLITTFAKCRAAEESETVESIRSAWNVETPRAAAGGRTYGMPRGAAGSAGPDEAPAAGEDARTLPVMRNSAGERFRDVKAVAERISTVEFEDWPLEGPRTMKWWWTEISRSWMGPVARHHAWRHENHLNDDDHQAVLHELLCEVLELLGCVDQCDLPNLAAAESAVRHVQYVEHEVKKKAEAKKAPTNAEYFLGRSRRTGGAVISPDLLKWVSEKAARESAILKEQRKAAEERSLLKGGEQLAPHLVPQGASLRRCRSLCSNSSAGR
jgi:hypothetical protein